jgi:hypothetical protein
MPPYTLLLRPFSSAAQLAGAIRTALLAAGVDADLRTGERAAAVSADCWAREPGHASHFTVRAVLPSASRAHVLEVDSLSGDASAFFRARRRLRRELAKGGVLAEEGGAGSEGAEGAGGSGGGGGGGGGGGACFGTDTWRELRLRRRERRQRRRERREERRARRAEGGGGGGDGGGGGMMRRALHELGVMGGIHRITHRAHREGRRAAQLVRRALRGGTLGALFSALVLGGSLLATAAPLPLAPPVAPAEGLEKPPSIAPIFDSMAAALADACEDAEAEAAAHAFAQLALEPASLAELGMHARAAIQHAGEADFVGEGRSLVVLLEALVRRACGGDVGMDGRCAAAFALSTCASDVGMAAALCGLLAPERLLRAAAAEAPGVAASAALRREAAAAARLCVEAWRGSDVPVTAPGADTRKMAQLLCDDGELGEEARAILSDLEEETTEGEEEVEEE